jgi:predicted phage tail protein
MEQVILQGHKGGDSKAHTPVEEKNTLLSKSYAKLLLAIGEGEFAGTPTAENIFLDGTPLKSAGGLDNFGGVKWDYRSGRSDQTYITGLPDISNEFAVNLALTDATPWTRLISTQQIDAVRITLAWPAVYEQKDNGDVVGYNIEYAIDVSTNGGAYAEQGKWSTNSQKTTVEYNRTHRINLPKPGTSWTVRVRRLTPNKNNGKFGDIMSVKSVAEVIDAKLRYPNTALLFLEFDAEAFGGSSIPKVSIKTKGRLIQVPSNYDPDTRVYSGVWNGTFKWAWTNNPAWVFYDLVINERFGLGARIKPDMVDKWTLYQVSQYCDVMVSNGKGGQEPRYTCNIYIQSRKEAWQVLRDIVSIFNGMLHWSGTQIVATADMPVAVNTLRTYSRSNVVEGKFIYGSTSEKTIATTALVSFDDPDNHFETAVEAVNDLNLVQRYKTWNQAEIAAMGVTSRGQAQRKGKYTMLTNSLNRMVTFKLGLEGYLPRPGEVVGVADQVLAGSNFSGRISAATIKTVTCDRVPNVVAGDILYVNKPDGTTGEGRTVQSVSGKVITVTANYSAIPTVELGWYVEKTTLKSQLYRITKVTWSDNDAKFEVTGVQYEDSKYAAVDSGARLESRPITTIPAGGQAAPTGLTISSFTYIEQTMAVTTLSVKWTPAVGAMNYEGQWRKDGGDWNNVGLTASTGFDVKGIYSGAYQARVRAINALGTKSVWVESTNTQLTGKVGAPPTLTAFTTLPEIFGIRINWAFQAGSDDGAFIQIQQADTIAGGNTTELTLVAYPAQTYVKSNMLGGVVKFFRGRLIDRTGNQGAWTAWTYGISEYGTDKILEAIVGEIKETHLGQELLTEIDKIEVIERSNELLEAQLGAAEASVAEVKAAADAAVADLNNSVTLLNGDLSALHTQVNNIKDAALYDPTKTYAKGTSARVGDRLYQAKQAVPINTSPPNTTYWLDVGQVIEEAGAVATQVGLNTVAITNQGGTLTAQGQKLDAFDVRLVDAEGDIITQGDALTNLQTTVTTQGNTITSQGNNITSLNNNLTTTNSNVTAAQNAANAANTLAGGKGKVLVQSTTPVTADQLAQNLWIDTTGGANTPKRWSGSAWLAVTDKVATDAAAAASSALTQVATKADSSVVSALTGRVTTAEGLITSQGSSITSLNNSLSVLGASGVNILPAEYTVFSATPPVTNLAAAVTTEVDTATLRGYALKMATTNGTSQTATFGAALTADSCNIPFKAQKYILSYWAKANVVGHQIASYLRVLLSDGVTFTTGPATLVTLTDTWARYSVVMDVSNATTYSGIKAQLSFQFNRSAVAGRMVWFDGIMLEAALNNVSTPSNFVIGQSFDQNSATSNAVSALTSTVTQQGDTLTSQGNSIVSLNNTIGSLGGENLLYNPSFDKPSTTTGLADGWTSGGTAVVVPTLVASTLDPAGFAQRVDATSLSASVYADVITAVTKRPAAVTGQIHTVSAYVRATAGCSVRLYVQCVNSAGSAIGTTTGTLVTTDGTWQRIVVTSNAAPAGVAKISIIARFYGTAAINAGFAEWDRAQLEISPVVTGWRDSGLALSSAQSATSTAVDALTNRVTATETAITASAQDITSLTTEVHFRELEELYAGDETDAQIDDTLRIASGAANATTALTSTVTQVDGKVTAQAQQITDLTASLSTTNGTVAGQAQAVSDLTATVTAQGNTLTTQAGSLTQLQSTVGGIAGNGSNLLPDTYSWITSTTLPATVMGTSMTRVGVAVAGSVSGFGYKMTTASTSTAQYMMLSPTNDAAGRNVSLEPGTYLVSMFVQGSVAGTARVSLFDGTHRNSPVLDFTTTRQRLTFICTVTSSTQASVIIYSNLSGLAAGVDITVDSVMVEKQIGTSVVPSPFVAGSSAATSSGQATAIDALNTSVTQVNGKIESVAQSVQSLTATARQDDGSGDLADALNLWQNTASIQTESIARADQDGAMAAKVETIIAQVNDNTALIQQESVARATADSVNATYTTSVQASLNNTNAMVQTQASAIATTDGNLNTLNTKVAAAYSIKLGVASNGQYYAAGMGIGIENTPAGMQSQVIFTADRFAIMNQTNNVTTSPFVVQGGQTIINSAVIGDATIGFAKIADNLQSTNFVSNSTGWALTKGGYLELNGSGGQGRISITNNVIMVFDAGGVLRVRLGLW